MIIIILITNHHGNQIKPEPTGNDNAHKHTLDNIHWASTTCSSSPKPFSAKNLNNTKGASEPPNI